MLAVVLIIAAILGLLYAILILLYRYWLLRLPVFESVEKKEPRNFFSVVIPARNEAANIPQCLLSVLSQDYPAALFEVIVINDHSTDETEACIRKLQDRFANLRLLNLSERIPDRQLNAYKKKAIELAIAESNGNWIVTTDADCMVQPGWLKLYDAYIQEKDPVFVAAPVMFTSPGGFLANFQLLDFMSLQAITAASVSAGFHTMCNGANLAYRKNVFYEVGQFRGIDQLASGDDMLLMHKIKLKFPDQLGYLYHPKAIVTTAPMPDWKSFLNQRIRWASKASSYQDRSIFWTLALVYAFNAVLCLLLCMSLFIPMSILYWLLLVTAKTLIELSLLALAARFYGVTAVLAWFPVMQPFHQLYTVMAGWLGKFGSYEWKGRTVK
ncbi:MAG: glycosyltransferase [Bacteroidota bacterium]|nr:glycosyltransferase [Bacteroidota bacterium]